MSRIRTATVTWITWLNYGSYLQAYALQHVINKLGYDNSIIDDERIVFPYGKSSNDAWIKKLPFYKQLYIRLSQKLHSCNPDKDARKVEKRYKKFREKYLAIDNNFNCLSELNDRYDLFIAGSDQIWAPTKEIFKPFYYLSFAKKKKISYAASVNSEFYPEEYKEPVSDLLKDFSHISVREVAGKLMLESFLHRNIEVSLDPTLLLTSKDWAEVSSHHSERQPYILCYLLSYNETYLQYAHDFAVRRNMPLYIFSNKEEYRPYANKMIAAGPSEFISCFRDASFVLTDSFHGTVFSILHEKEFITFKRFNGKEGNNQNERLINLFEITGIENRFIEERDLSLDLIPKQIDYNIVKNKLEIRREQSISYLKKALS